MADIGSVGFSIFRCISLLVKLLEVGICSISTISFRKSKGLY